MTASPQRAKHRAARRPITSLDDLAIAATGSLATVGRRSAVVAASGGLMMTMALPASAAPADGPAQALPTVDTAALTAQARAALATSPVVSVPIDADWGFEAPEFEVVANPEPEPEPEPAPERTSSTASRSNERAEAPAAAASTETAAPAPQSASGNAVLEIASRYVGSPYVSGGTSPSGFDCSGFTQYVFAQLGINLPRTSGEQRYAGTVVSRDQAQPGDLIWSPGHIAIYAGGNQQIDSPRPGKTVQYRAIWQSNPTFIRVAG